MALGSRWVATAALGVVSALAACGGSDAAVGAPFEDGDAGASQLASDGGETSGDAGPDDAAAPNAPDGDAATCAPPGPDAGALAYGDFTVGPTYTDAPELTVKAGVPRGTVVTFTMDSHASTIYPGVTGPYTRSVWVYVPKQYVDGTPAPLLVVQDGGNYVNLVPPALDTLIDQKRVPPMIAVLVNSGGGDGRGSERGLEYDRVSANYAKFVETELLPAVTNNAAVKNVAPHLAFTTDPDARATMGGSSGGAAAFTMAWFRPDLWHRVLTYSGTFVNQYPETAYPHGAWEYHEHLIPQNPRKPVRVFLEVGQNDNNLDAKFGDGMHDWVAANKAMASVMKAKGWAYRFDYALAAGHVDRAVVRQTLPETLVWLWAGYPSCPSAP